MSLSKQASLTKLTGNSTTTTLNPNAAAFVPFSLRSSSAPTDPTPNLSPASGKQLLDRSESSLSANSDDEARQYWQHHLPDDITPDFKVMGDDDPHPHPNPQPHASLSLSLSGLSLNSPGSNPTRPSAVTSSAYLFNGPHSDIPTQPPNGIVFGDKGIGYPLSVHGDHPSSTSYRHLNNKPWEMQVPGSENSFGSGRDGMSFDETAMHSTFNGLASDNALPSENDLNPVDYLASQFPGFAVESLAEVFFANSCDLNLTIEMLTQLELQVDDAFNQNMNSKTLSAPNLTSMDFPALPVPDSKTNLRKYSGEELQQTINPYGSFEKDNMLLFKSGSSFTSKGATDFASAVRKLASQDSGFWKHDRNGSADASIGSSRSSNALAGSYNSSSGRSVYTDRVQGRGSARASMWLETGDAVANLYSELREEARDHARIRNTYFEQARQAYLVGNKGLAKELSLKGQLHNMQMKAAHNKAQESIYRQRNPVSPVLQGGGRCQEKMIDLHGLHVSEAMHVLKQELGVLRSAARLAEQRLHVYICVGTGHHTRGSRTPARLPIAVQRYLLEEEGLDYSEPQPGLLRVVLY